MKEEMDKSYSITIRPSEPNIKPTKLTGQIPAEDWKMLLKFRADAMRLLLVAKECDNLSVRFRLTYSRDDNVFRLETKEIPTSRDLQIILHNLRPFILQNEPYQFYKTVKLLQRYMRHEIIKLYFQPIKDMFSGKAWQDGTEIQANIFLSEGSLDSVILNCEKTLMDWLNAYEYHRDIDKQELMKKIDAVCPSGFPRVIYSSLIIDKYKAVAEVCGIISAIKKRGGFEIITE